MGLKCERSLKCVLWDNCDYKLDEYTWYIWNFAVIWSHKCLFLCSFFMMWYCYITTAHQSTDCWRKCFSFTNKEIVSAYRLQTKIRGPFDESVHAANFIHPLYKFLLFLSLSLQSCPHNHWCCTEVNFRAIQTLIWKNSKALLSCSVMKNVKLKS